MGQLPGRRGQERAPATWNRWLLNLSLPGYHPFQLVHSPGPQTPGWTLRTVTVPYPPPQPQTQAPESRCSVFAQGKDEGVEAWCFPRGDKNPRAQYLAGALTAKCDSNTSANSNFLFMKWRQLFPRLHPKDRRMRGCGDQRQEDLWLGLWTLVPLSPCGYIIENNKLKALHH